MNDISTSAGPPSNPPELTMAVGFVGIGHMGLQLAQRLVHAGIPVIVWNRTQSKVDPLVAAGAKWSTSPKDLAKSIGKGITFLMLTDGAAVKKVLFGVKGLARGAPAGALFVNVSTIDPDESRAFAARLQERGIHYLDAPVAGSVDQVPKGEVIFFAGGEESEVARARPLLEKMGRRVEHMGPTGSGNSMKLANNLLMVGIAALSAEALALAEGLHLDRARVIAELLAGGGHSLVLERKAPDFLSRTYPPLFTTALARKDLKLAEKVATREGRPLKMNREARRLLDETVALGHSEDDFSAVFEATLARGRGSAPSPAAPEASMPTEPTPGAGNPSA
jgi:3-hydroxyisobutyrate dehydrogenase-like beta-hydroxyacid dehydrogenase